MTLKQIVTATLALIALPTLSTPAFAYLNDVKHCPQFSPHLEYINGDQIQKDGAFYEAQNDPKKGTDIYSSWFWKSIPECTRGLAMKIEPHPQRFLGDLFADRFTLGDGIVTFSQLTQNGINVAFKAEGGQYESWVMPAQVELTEKFSQGHYKTSINTKSIQLVENIRGDQNMTVIDAQKVKTDVVEAETILFAPTAIIGDRNVIAYIESLEARIADLEAKLATQQ